MGLLDNLFKPKPETAGEKSVESVENGGPHAASSEASSPKQSPFLAPKIYVPRSSVQIVPPGRISPSGDRKLAPVDEPAQAPAEIVLTLGDVLSRIPTHFLREGKPDLRRELRFPSEGIAADIARGRAAVYLAEIVAQCPELFLPEVNGFDDIQIRLPLQKLVEQIACGAGNPASVSKPAPEPPPAPLAAPAVEKPAAPPPAPAETGEVQIHLSLAAILRRCPREIIVQPLPPVEESVRITFPFAPIERQLSTGQVEVSSLRFIAALPLGLMKCFEAKAGVKVPLPLEEIFQNLPNQSPLPGAATQLHVAGLPQEVPADVTDRLRENARLAEAILLEPMSEPVANAESDLPAPVTPPVAENVVINASFAPDSSHLPALEIPEPVSTAGLVPPVIPEPRKTEAALELEAQLEALAAGDAQSDSRLVEDALLEPLPAPSVEKTPMPPSEPAPEPFPEPVNPAVETIAQISSPMDEPAAPPVELPAFRQFAPPLRPPLILQPNSGPGELRPLAEADPAPTPAPPKSVEEILPEPVASTPVPPAISASPLGEAPLPSSIAEPPAVVEPEPEPVVEKTAPIAADPTPTIADPVAQTLRIGPPQFRPFVVHAPPIVFAPKDDTTSVPPRESPAGETPPAESVAPVPPPVAMQPPVAESRPEFPKETIAEHLPLSPESLLEKPAAPSPELPPFESASPPLLDGKVREFFQSDAPLPLPRVCQILAALPGIHGCILVTRAAESQSGELPAGLDPAVIRDLSQRMRGALADRAETFRVGEVQHLTLHAEQYSLSFFTRGEACACAIHRARIFLPGVSERFAAVAEELARASH